MMMRPFVTPTEDGTVPYLQSKLAILDPIRRIMLHIVKQLEDTGKNFDHHMITTQSPFYSLHINRVACSNDKHFTTDTRSRWQFIYSSKERSSGPILKIVYNRTIDAIESGFQRIKNQVRQFKDFDDAHLLIQVRLWHGLFNLVKAQQKSVSTPSVEEDNTKSFLPPSFKQLPQSKPYDRDASLYGPLPPIPLLDELVLNLHHRETFFSMNLLDNASS